MTTKEKIFLSAAELFAERSYANVSMREIAEKVGIKAASIYNHYSSKEEILDEILTHYKNRIEQFLASQSERLSSDEPLTVEDIQFAYDPEEIDLMFWVTRIVITEQFSYKQAAETLLGTASKRYYTQGQSVLLQQMYERGLIKEKKNITLYADMMARLGVSYQQDFVHHDYTSEVSNLHEMYIYFLDLVLSFEGTLDRRDEVVHGLPGIHERRTRAEQMGEEATV